MSENDATLRKAAFAGLTIGVALGGLFGLAVVSIADCGGPDCMYERMLGVVAHAAGITLDTRNEQDDEDTLAPAVQKRSS